MMITLKQQQELVRRATRIRRKAYAPYSGYRVGAAALGASGRIYAGVNIESAAYTTTGHAEMMALAAGVAGGERELLTLSLVTDNALPPFPCAICRQGMAEFDRGKMIVIAANLSGKTRATTLRRLYPHPFGSRQLGIDPAKY